MSQFNDVPGIPDPSNRDWDDFDISFLSPYLQQRFSSLSLNIREILKDMYKDGVDAGGEIEGRKRVQRFLEGDIEMPEILESELNEWSKLVEEASTPDERMQIIKEILTMAQLEKMLGRSGISDSLKKQIKSDINVYRENQGWSPKYPL